jgi:hypothetical protein
MVLAFMMTSATAVVLVNIIRRGIVFDARNSAPALLFVVMFCGLYVGRDYLALSIATYLLLKGSQYFASAFVRDNSFNFMFLGAWLVGCAPLVFAPAVIFMLLIPLACIIFMRSWRETLVALFGMLLPILMCAYVLWAIGEGFTEIFVSMRDILLAPYTSFKVTAVNIPLLAYAGLCLLLALVSVVSFILKQGEMRTRAYKIYVYMAYFLLIALLGLVFTCHSADMLMLAAAPLSVVVTGFFSRFKGWLPTLLYILLLLFPVAYRLYLMCVNGVV